MEIEFLAGTHISAAAKQLCEAAGKHGKAAGSFNEIPLIADRTTTPEQVVSDFNTKMEARAKSYRGSPGGQKAERERDERRAESQATHDDLMKELPTLDMRNDVAVLDWICAMQDPSDHVGVIVRRQTIVETFEKAGFVAGANCGNDYKPGDRQNMFRYLVGQALDGLKDGPAIHPIIHKFADEWRRDFASRWLSITEDD